MSNYQKFCTACVSCGEATSKAFARANGGKCKACATGVARVETGPMCPDCGVNRLTRYQAAHHYHCDACTREADPVGHMQEVMGYHDHGDY